VENITHGRPNEANLSCPAFHHSSNQANPEKLDGLSRSRSRGHAKPAMTTSDKVIEVLKFVSEFDEVQDNLDLPLYDFQILDSLKTVRLIVAFSQEFGIDIPPSEFERERWATPRKIVADIEHKIGSE
jgi:D-alanine--poly(phosphoribitol) ligase subunit 2